MPPAQTISLDRLDTFVIDEADLILSYGHDEDVRTILGSSYLPKVYQSLLMSATMTEDVAALKGLVLRKPVSLPSSSFVVLKNPHLPFTSYIQAILRLEEEEDDSTLSQYFTR